MGSMPDYIDKMAVYAAACKGCIMAGDECGTCYCPEPGCERLTLAFVSAPAADVVEVLPELRKAVERLNEEYKKATQLSFVRDPLAYALHKTWRAADAKNIGGKGRQ